MIRSRMVEAEAAGLAFHLLDAGRPDDDVLLLLHGGTETSAIWVDFMPALVDGGWRVVAPDSRGHGGTRNAGGQPLTYKRMAGDMVALLSALGAGRAAVAGFSDGANIAFEMARLAPAVTRAVVLHGLASAGVTDEYRRAIEGFFSAPFGQPADLAAVGATSYGRQLAAWHAPQGPDGWQQLIRLVEPLFYAPPLFSQADFDSVRCPALVLTGDSDGFMPLPEHVRTAAALPDAELVVWPDVGHGFPRQPAAFTDPLLDFLEPQSIQRSGQL